VTQQRRDRRPTIRQSVDVDLGPSTIFVTPVRVAKAGPSSRPHSDQSLVKSGARNAEPIPRERPHRQRTTPEPHVVTMGLVTSTQSP